MGGMTAPITPPRSSLPHHKLVAYGVAVELLTLVKAAQISDAKLRDEALRAAKSACLNTAGDALAGSAARCIPVADRLVALLTGLIRPAGPR